MTFRRSEFTPSSCKIPYIPLTDMADSKDLPLFTSERSVDDRSDSLQPGSVYAVKDSLGKDLFSKGAANTFETESLESYYKPIDGYEGLHRYDPSYTWEPAEEKRLVRRVRYEPAE